MLRHVGLRLVIIVIRHEILNRIVRKELFELAVKLCRQRFVVGQYQRGALCLLDNLGHDIRLACARRAEQSLMLVASLYALYQLLDSLGLIACRPKI